MPLFQLSILRHWDELLSWGSHSRCTVLRPNYFTDDRLRLILLDFFFKAWNADERSLTVEDKPKETLPSERAPKAHPAKGLVRKLDLYESTNGDTADPRSRISETGEFCPRLNVRGS